ncbi:MAG TPA: hypothetical protein VEC19_07635 [Usitatibacter sp.]|nr:hypothetical protein [Usitatibacter sp.]
MIHASLLASTAVLAVAAVISSAHAEPPHLSAGRDHSLAVHSDGTVRAWGEDAMGQLGLGRVVRADAPLLAGIAGVRQLAAGSHHSLALKADGTVWAWGSNETGALGDGSRTNSGDPVRAGTLQGMVAVAAGGSQSLALAADGRVWHWGDFLGGDDTLLPQLLPALTDVIAIAAGIDSGLGLRRDGTVWQWSWQRPAPAQVEGIAQAVAIAAGDEHFFALRADGTLWAWGNNGSGRLGDGTYAERTAAVQVTGLADVVAVAAGSRHSVAVRRDGSVWAWGDNGFRQLADPSAPNHAVPMRIGGLPSTASLSAGRNHTLLLAADGSLWSWGENRDGQLGRGNLSLQEMPARVTALPAVAASAAGAGHSLALLADGTVRAWGDNTRGQLADATPIRRTTPTQVPGLSAMVSVATGYSHSLALGSDGRVWSWGNNHSGMLGDGTTTTRGAPAAVPGLPAIAAISAGASHSMALARDGIVWTWGLDDEGQLGDGDLSYFYRETPAPVPFLTGAVAIAAGFYASFALKSDGTVWAWGDNEGGQLGDGTTTSRQTPVRIQGLSDIVAIAPSMALGRDGRVWTWGSNRLGQLGDGTSTDRLTPGRVESLTDVVAIEAGDGFRVAITRDGNVWYWGNRMGDIYNTSQPLRRLPERVAELSNIVQVSSWFHNLALAADGSVWAWGPNRNGALGDGTLAHRRAPVVVLREGGAGSLGGNDWFLDLDPARASAIPGEAVPRFLLVARPTGADVVADVRFRSADIGTSGSIFVFALAPASQVLNPIIDPSLPVRVVAKSRDKALPNGQCVLAQLNASGQLIGVSAQNLQALVTGVFSAQGNSVAILNGVPMINVGGTTFFVGLGPNGTAMINGGNNRSAVSFPGAQECRPEAPQTGWWWNPAEDGRGFSIERQGDKFFFASFLYDPSGRSTWYVSTGDGVSLDGSLYRGPIFRASGGQPLGGPYRGAPTIGTEGEITLSFHTATLGTLVWPGGAVPIERFNIVPHGLATGAVVGTPQSGWWWNPEETGRGFFMEWQNNTLDIAGYMYDDVGNPVWYLTVGDMTPDGRTFNGQWWSYGNGMTIAGPWRPHTRTNDNVAPVTITFSGPDTALMTLPNGRSTSLKRHRF